MARISFAELQARHKALQEKQQNRQGNGNSDYYLFWKMEAGQEIEVRILPDLWEDNPLVYEINKLMHHLSINGKQRKSPCLRMWDEQCPVCDTAQEFYKIDGDGSARGSALYRKRSVLIRAMILKDPLPVEETGPRLGKVMTLEFGRELRNRVLNSMSEFAADDGAPYDPDTGFNFIIKKQMKGKYGDYTASTFARRPSAIPAEYRGNWVLTDLRTLLPSHPGIDKVSALLESHLHGTEYSENSSASTTSSVVGKMLEESVEDDASIPFEATAASLVITPDVSALTGTASPVPTGINGTATVSAQPTVTVSAAQPAVAQVAPAASAASAAPATQPAAPAAPAAANGGANVDDILAKIRNRNKGNNKV